MRFLKQWRSPDMRSEHPKAIFMFVQSIRSPCSVLRLRSNRQESTVCSEKNIFDSGFDFDIELRLGAGAFVCGERDGSYDFYRRKQRRAASASAVPGAERPVSKPTILNNVETYANIPQIIVNGPEWFASMGTEKSKGTKVFALAERSIIQDL